MDKNSKVSTIQYEFNNSIKYCMLNNVKYVSTPFLAPNKQVLTIYSTKLI